MKEANQLGAYLKARRAHVTPEEAGLPRGGVRRVPGLRREEVASLTGLSVDYYTRLEQGRELHPSASVLNALARTLRLEPDARRYLFAIATPDQHVPVVRGRSTVGENLVELLDEWPNHPAVLLDSCHNVLAANQLGAALYAGHRYSGNLAKLVFLDEGGPRFFRDWPTVAASCAAGIRATASHDPGDADLLSLVGELTVRSAEFARLWARADVREKTSGTVRFRHPVVGELDLVYETLRPAGAPHLVLKVLRAGRDTVAREKLAVLGSVAASGQHAGDDLVSEPVEVVGAGGHPDHDLPPVQGAGE